MIRGYFNPRSGWPVPWIRAFRLIPDLSPDPAPVDFIVDTGCSGTVLHPPDTTRRFGVDIAEPARSDFRPVSKGSFGIGGTALNFVLPASYGFVDDSGEIEMIEGEILVAQWSPANQGLPSLLGWDVHRYFELRAIQRAGDVFLHRLPP